MLYHPKHVIEIMPLCLDFLFLGKYRLSNVAQTYILVDRFLSRNDKLCPMWNECRPCCTLCLSCMWFANFLFLHSVTIRDYVAYIFMSAPCSANTNSANKIVLKSSANILQTGSRLKGIAVGMNNLCADIQYI